MSRCPDCENINVSSLIPSGKGNGRCKECKGTGIDQAASALVQFGTLGLEGKNIPCKICSGTGQCQTCGGTGEVKYHHTSPTSSSSEDNSSDGYTLIAKIIGFILIVAAIVWFVFAVAIPLIAINLALITLLVGLTRKGWNKFFFPLSILGAIYIVLDYNYGWFTKTLVNNLSFFKVIIPIFFYINIVAGLTAAYFTVRNILNMKNPQSKDEGEFSKRNLVIMGCLLLIGGLTVGLQMYFHSYKNHETQVGSQRNNEISIVIPFKDIKNGVLKAGIRITVAVSIPDVIHSLSGYSMNPTLIKALQKASEKENTGTHDFVDLFFESFQEVDPNAKLASSFNTEELKGMINFNSSNQEVIKVIRKKCDEAIDKTCYILASRIGGFGVERPNIEKSKINGRIMIEISGNKNSNNIKKLLKASANLECWETYTIKELAEYFPKANQRLTSIQGNLHEKFKDKPFFIYPQTAQTNNKNSITSNSIIGYASINDTSNINQMLKLVRTVFPRDLKLVWSVKSWIDAPDVLGLVALKITSQDGSPALSGNLITRSKLDYDQNGHSQVVMKMTSEGKKTWQSIIGRNIGRQVVIVLDGYAYSVINITKEIPDGLISISGNFSKEECLYLANLIQAGKLPAPIDIIKEEVVGK